MSIVIYTYHDPYKIDKEPYWKDIKNCPYFCVSQTLVNGLRKHYKGLFDGGRVTTVKWLTDSLYEHWASPAWIVKQHTDIDNIIMQGLTEGMLEEKNNIAQSFLFNREEVFNSIRTLFELGVDINSVQLEKLNKEQAFILDIYRRILSSDKKADFFLKGILTESEIDTGLVKAMTAIHSDYDCSCIDMSTVVIHGVHQFAPIILKSIEALSKYKKVILMFNYQKQYERVYQTWFDIYSAFDCEITDYDRAEFYPTDPASVSYEGNILADQLGKLVNGQRKGIGTVSPYEILEFDNMTEFAGYVADIFESAKKIDPTQPMHSMKEQIYSADGSVNDILKIYFPEQFGERQFLNYPIGHFFLAIANMWNPETNNILITDINDIRECLNANILDEASPGELISIFGKMEALFDGCTSIKQMRKRLKSVKKKLKHISDETEQEQLCHISYYSVNQKELDVLDRALEDLDEIAAHFFEDFEDKAHNFRDFYRRLKRFLEIDIMEQRDLSDEFRDIIKRVLMRLNAVENIDASASFECLKSTMSIYLLQETKPGRSANWIVRNFEQIDGDILRSGHENPNIIYHFACLEDEDIGTVKKAEFPWPLDNAFFEIAQNPVDWKYQVYVRCSNEYKNFKRYALIYGLEFNRAKYKLSYVRRNGEKEREPYYLLKILGIDKKRYVASKTGQRNDHSSGISLEIRNRPAFDKYDYYRFRICRYRFLMESLIEGNTVYRDNFLILKYLEIVLENIVKEKMQGFPVAEDVLIDKLEEVYDELNRFYPFAQNFNRIDIINTVRSRMMNTKEKRFDNLTKEDRKNMLVRELFIHDRLVDPNNKGVNILQDKFPDISRVQVQELLNEEKLKQIKFNKEVNVWCKYCSIREACAAYYAEML